MTSSYMGAWHNGQFLYAVTSCCAECLHVLQVQDMKSSMGCPVTTDNGKVESQLVHLVALRQ